MPGPDHLQQLREEQRRRFQKAKAEGDIPEVRRCPNCDAPTFSSAVCPVSGHFHNLEKKKLIGGTFVESNIVSSSQLMAAIDQTRVKWAASRTQLVRVDAQSINIFQSFVAQMDWNLQRYGLLYGLHDAASQTVEVHAVYEPEQHGNAFTFETIDDPHLDKVDRIAKELGLRPVGVVCTHPVRDTDQMLLNFRELLLCAKTQSRFGDECVLLTVGPSVAAAPSSEEAVTPHETASSASADAGNVVVSCQAWQASPQCVHLYQLDVLREAPIAGSALQTVEQARNVHSTIPLEVAQTDTDPKGHQRFVTKAPSHEIDTRWFTSYIAVQQFDSPVVRGAFMRLSRPGMPPPMLQNLRNYLKDPKRQNMSFAEGVADFHVLVYLLTQIFTGEEDLTALCEVASTKTMTEAARNYEAVLKAMMAIQ